MRGSSPRSRGTETLALPAGWSCRFIPALAGNGVFDFIAISPPSVHPRARGERCQPAHNPVSNTGSSPRSRGTGAPHRRDRWWLRFIPALAGNGAAHAGGMERHPVHPRARGERNNVLGLANSPRGSSPRSRGTGDENDTKHMCPRFIPALAGNGLTAWCISPMASVHPRARGERYRCYWRGTIYCGSSPRSRGTGSNANWERFCTRFIPALAGNGHTGRYPRGRQPVHPRARGERQGQPVIRPDWPGSSPRSRGTGWALPSKMKFGRFIPALAGNGSVEFDFFHLLYGSSPRSRGTVD